MDDVVNLENHLHDLRGEQELLLLAAEGLNDLLLLHVVGTATHAVDAKARVLLSDLASLNVGKSLDASKTAILGKRNRDGVEGVRKGTDSVLLDSGDLIGSLQK